MRGTKVYKRAFGGILLVCFFLVGCTESKLRETNAQNDAFQLCPPVEEMEVSKTPIKIAYLKRNDIWIWDERTGEATALTNSHDVSDFKISPDQERIAFTRGININPTTLMAFEPVPSFRMKDLWVMNIDGTDERKLLTAEDLLSYRQDDTHEVVDFSQYEWIPNSRQIAFSTQGIVLFPHDFDVYYINDDLRLIDVDNFEITQLLPAGDGGHFSVSPNGEFIAVGKADGIGLFELVDGIYHEFPVEFAVQEWSVGNYVFRPEPKWVSDSSYFVVITEYGGKWPDGDMTIWQVSLPDNGAPPKFDSIAEFTGFPLNTQFSPDLKYLTLIDLEEGFEVINLEENDSLFSITGQTTATDQIDFNSWHPDSMHFVYSSLKRVKLSEDSLYSMGISKTYYGDLCQSQTVIIEAPLIWVDAKRYITIVKSLMNTNPRSGYDDQDLRLNTVGGESILIDSDEKISYWDISPVILTNEGNLD